jgi:hypothetical protein
LFIVLCIFCVFLCIVSPFVYTPVPPLSLYKSTD